MDENKIEELYYKLNGKMEKLNEYNDEKQDARLEYISKQLEWTNRFLFIITLSIILPIIVKIAIYYLFFDKIIELIKYLQ